MPRTVTLTHGGWAKVCHVFESSLGKFQGSLCWKHCPCEAREYESQLCLWQWLVFLLLLGTQQESRCPESSPSQGPWGSGEGGSVSGYEKLKNDIFCVLVWLVFIVLIHGRQPLSAELCPSDHAYFWLEKWFCWWGFGLCEFLGTCEQAACTVKEGGPAGEPVSVAAGSLWLSKRALVLLI